MSKSWLRTPQEQLRDFGDLFDSKPDFSKSDFDGITYEPAFDSSRLRGEMAVVFNIMKDGQWRTLAEISRCSANRYYPEASISARLRDFRKRRFGTHTVNRRRRGEASRGIWEYQLL